ncbi:hypothetical protein ACCS79_03680 [Rhizobium johnstonii]|uniref:hypothetical protein n=1 Tax=Rhizobium johnstonii TaxID=3019933 RepID=UPI003F9A7736
MLLEKLNQNRDALMKIGTEAIAEGRKLGLKPSVAIRDADRIIDHEADEPVPHEPSRSLKV